jgi:hypothetical protein
MLSSLGDLATGSWREREERRDHGTRERAAPGALDAGRAAWLAAVPAALATLAAIVVLGPPLGRLLLPVPHFGFWPQVEWGVLPEPTEQARFLIALTAPLLLSGLTILLARRPPRLLARPAAGLAGAAELAGILIVAGCFVAQRLQPGQSYTNPEQTVTYFTLPTLLVAAAIAAALVAGARSARWRARFAAWAAESRGRRVGAALVALALTAITLLPAINTDASIVDAVEPVRFHLQFTYDESMAVLDGRSPLGNFAAQYASLWPYVLAGGMSVLGSQLVVFTGLMAALNGVTLLALFAVLRRLTRSSIAALALFAPLLATSAFRLHGDDVQHFSLINYFGVLPLRYAGPFLLAWLTARHLDGARPHRAWPLFLVGGLVLLNNTDFGIAAVGATLAALLWTRAGRGAVGLPRLALEAAAGLGGALAIVIVLLLARTGSPPQFALLFRYARIFVLGGFSMLPMRPVVGFSTVIFLTYVSAVGIATVRALRGDPDRLMTGLLAWIGVFGLGAGSYYVGHSLSELLTYTFPCWALAVTLLTILALRGLAARAHRRPVPSEIACLFAFGLLACSLAQTPLPWVQARRLAVHAAPYFAQPPGQAFVAAHTRRGESVLILTTLGHRMAVNLGLEDVETYTGSRSVQTVEQLEDSVTALSRAGGSKAFVWLQETYAGLQAALARDFTLRAHDAQGMELWVARGR